MVREYHKLPHGPPSPVLPSEPPQQEVRGPAGGGEVGSQCDNPTQQQVLTGSPAGWDPPQFSSTDVREKQEKLSPSSLVTLFTRYCHQKPGGGFTLPKIAASDFCPFCNKGHTCLGQFCKGKEKPVEKRKVGKTLTTQSILIPGLEGSNQASSSVLYSSSFTSTTKRKISALSPSSLIFKPNPQKATFSISSSLSSIKVFKSSAPKSKKKKSNHVGYEESLKLQRKLKSILLHANL